MSNLTINVLKTAKFKTTRIQLSFLSEPTKKEIGARAVLLNMMKQQTKTYPTKAILLNHLHERYNMRVSALPSKIGKVQMLSFTIEFIDSMYTLEENDMFLDATDVLESIIKEPLLTEKIFQQEKRILEEYFDSIYADKSQYALISMLKQMYKDPINHIDGLGDKEDIQKLSLQDIKNAYTKLFDGQVICTVLGHVDETRVSEILADRFSFGHAQQFDFSFTIKDHDMHHEQEITETQNIKQTNLVLGLHMPIYFNDSDYLKTRLFNILLGGHSESILFKEIREKQNMAYFISSSYDPYHGLFVIQTGIEQKNKDKVIELIKASIKKIQEEDISDGVFEQSRNQLKNALIQSQDSQARLTMQTTLKSLFQINDSIDDRINELQTFKKEDLSVIAQKLILDTIFVLTGDSNEKN